MRYQYAGPEASNMEDGREMGRRGDLQNPHAPPHDRINMASPLIQLLKINSAIIKLQYILIGLPWEAMELRPVLAHSGSVAVAATVIS